MFFVSVLINNIVYIFSKINLNMQTCWETLSMHDFQKLEIILNFKHKDYYLRLSYKTSI